MPTHNQTKLRLTSLMLTILSFSLGLASLLVLTLVLLGFNITQRWAVTHLENMNQQIQNLTTNKITYTIPLSDNIPLKATFALTEGMPIKVALNISQTLPVNMRIPFKDNIIIPINTIIPIQQSFDVAIPLLGQNIPVSIPIQGNIPIDLTVAVPINTIIPIDSQLPINLPIDTEIVIKPSQPLNIDTQVPIQIAIPIEIELSKTPFGTSLSQTNLILNQLISVLKITITMSTIVLVLVTILLFSCLAIAICTIFFPERTISFMTNYTFLSSMIISETAEPTHNSSNINVDSSKTLR